MGALTEAVMPSRRPCCTVPVFCSEACHDRVEQLLAGIRPGNSSLERRTRITEYMQKVVSECFSDSQSAVHLVQFGSVPLMTFLPDGDIDLSIMSADTSLRDTWANRLNSWLEEEQLRQEAAFRITNVQVINAEVKLLKCLVDNIVVDISYHQVGGITALRFLEEVDKLIEGHIFKRSIILVKAWCYYESRVLGAHHGLFSTYALEVLVLYVFNLHHKHIKSPIEVLYLFLHECGSFDWDRYCLSLKGRIPLGSFPEFAVEPMAVEDLLLSPNVEAACLRRAREHEILAGIQVGHTTPPATPANSTGATTNQDAAPPAGIVAARPPASFTVRAINIQDPLQVTNNVGRSVTKSNLFRVRKAFAYGASLLAKVMCKEGDECCAAFDDFFRNVWNAQRPGRHNRHQARSTTPQLPAPLPQQPIPQQVQQQAVQPQQQALQQQQPSQQQQQVYQQQQQAVGSARDQAAHVQHMQAVHGGYVQMPRAGTNGGRASPMAQANGNSGYVYSRSPVGELHVNAMLPGGQSAQNAQQQQQQRGAQRHHNHAASMPSTPSGQHGSSSSTPPLDDSMANAVLQSTAHMAAMQAVSDGGMHQPHHGPGPANMLGMYHPQQAALLMAQYQQAAIQHHQIMSMAQAQHMQGMQHAAEAAAAAYKGQGGVRRVTDPHAATRPTAPVSAGGRIEASDNTQVDSSKHTEALVIGNIVLEAQDSRSRRSLDEPSGGRVRPPQSRDRGDGIGLPTEQQEGQLQPEAAPDAPYIADKAQPGQPGKEPRSASVPAEVGAAAAGPHQPHQAMVASAGNSPAPPHFDYRAAFPFLSTHPPMSIEQIQQLLVFTQGQQAAAMATARQPDAAAAQRRNSTGTPSDGGKADNALPQGQQLSMADPGGASRLRTSTGPFPNIHNSQVSMQQAPHMHPAAAIGYARANPGYEFQLHGLSPTMPYLTHLPAPPPPSVAPIHHSPPSMTFQVGRNVQRASGPAPLWPPQQLATAAPTHVRQGSTSSQPRHAQHQHGSSQQLGSVEQGALPPVSSQELAAGRPHSAHASHTQQARVQKPPGAASSIQPQITVGQIDLQSVSSIEQQQRRAGGAQPAAGQPQHHMEGLDGQASADLAWQPSGVWSEDMDASMSGEAGELVTRTASKAALPAPTYGSGAEVPGASRPAPQGAPGSHGTPPFPIAATGLPSQPGVAQMPALPGQPAAGTVTTGQPAGGAHQGAQAPANILPLAGLNSNALLNMLVPPQQLSTQMAAGGGSLPASLQAQLSLLQGVASNASSTASSNQAAAASSGGGATGPANGSTQHAAPGLPALPPNVLMGQHSMSAVPGSMMLPIMDPSAASTGNIMMGLPAPRSNTSVTQGTPLQLNMNMPVMMGSMGLPHMPPQVVQGLPVPTGHPSGMQNSQGGAPAGAGALHNGMFNAAFMDMFAAQHGLSRPPHFIQAPIPPPPIPGMLPPPLSSSTRPMGGYFPPFLAPNNAAGTNASSGGGPAAAHRGNANEDGEGAAQLLPSHMSTDLPQGVPALLPMPSGSGLQPQQSQTAAGAGPLSPGKQPASQPVASAPLWAQLPAAAAPAFATSGPGSSSNLAEAGRVTAAGARVNQGRSTNAQPGSGARTASSGPYAIQITPSTAAVQPALAPASTHSTPPTASPRGPSQAGSAIGVPWAQELPTAVAVQSAVQLQPAQQLPGGPKTAPVLSTANLATALELLTVHNQHVVVGQPAAVLPAVDVAPQQSEQDEEHSTEASQSVELVAPAHEQGGQAQLHSAQQQRSKRSGQVAAAVEGGAGGSNRPPTGRAAAAAALTTRGSHDPQRQGRGTDSPSSTCVPADVASAVRTSLVTPPKRLSVNLETQLSNDSSSIPSTTEQDDGKQPSSQHAAAARNPRPLRPQGSPGLSDASVAMVRQALAGVGSQLLSKGASRALTHHARAALQSSLSQEELPGTRGSGGLESAGGSGTLQAHLGTRLSISQVTASGTPKAAAGHLASSSSMGDTEGSNLHQAPSLGAPASNRSTSPISKDSSWNNLHAATRPTNSRSRGNSGAATPALGASGGLNAAAAAAEAVSAATAGAGSAVTGSGRAGHSGGGSAGSSGRLEGAGPRLAGGGAAWQLQHMMNSLQQASREAGAGPAAAARREAAMSTRPSLDRTSTGTRAAANAAVASSAASDTHSSSGGAAPQRSSGSGLWSTAPEGSQAPKNLSNSSNLGQRMSGGGQQNSGTQIASGGGSSSLLGQRRSSSSLSASGNRQQGQASNQHSHSRGGASASGHEEDRAGGLAHRSSGEFGHRRSFGASGGIRSSHHGASSQASSSQVQQTGTNFKLAEEEFPSLGRPSTQK